MHSQSTLLSGVLLQNLDKVTLRLARSETTFGADVVLCCIEIYINLTVHHELDNEKKGFGMMFKADESVYNLSSYTELK